MRKVLIMFLMAVLAVTSFGDDYFVVADALNMRKIPAVNGSVEKTLKYGDVISVVETGKNDIINGIGGTWIKASYEGKTGWCFDSYLIDYKYVADYINSLGDTPKAKKMFGKVSKNDQGSHVLEYKNSKIGNSVSIFITKYLEDVSTEDTELKDPLLKEEIFIENGLNKNIVRLEYKDGSVRNFSIKDTNGSYNISLEDINGKLAARNTLVKYCSERGSSENFYLFYSLFRKIDEFAQERCKLPLIKREESENSKKTTKLPEVEKAYYAISDDKCIDIVAPDNVEVLYSYDENRYKKEIFKMINGKWMLSEIYFKLTEEDEYGD